MIIVDGFYEHHQKHGKTYPYHITLNNGDPFALAGLWDTWSDPKTGLKRNTVTITTTSGNALMSGIHNNPKATEPRMPVILTPENEQIWLDTNVTDMRGLKSLAVPYDEKMKAYPVRRLRGKSYVGNIAAITTPYNYPELAGTDNLFDSQMLGMF